MRAFPVPVQITEEERVIGGMLTLRQLLYITLGVVLGGLVFLLTFLPVIIRLFIFVMIVLASTVLAFIKIHDLRADQYLYLYVKWKKSPRAIYLKGENDSHGN